jgi:RimJ/RimL family protein N-acetyltransferase
MDNDHTRTMLFTTPRLIVRPFRHEDAPAIMPIWSHPESMRMLGSGVPWVTDVVSAEACLERTCRYYDEHEGYGIFAVELKAGPALAGHVLLKPMDTGEVEVGWLVGSGHRGLGIASESAEGMLTYGFKQLGVESIVAIMFPHNTASRRVAERLGMHYQGTRQEREHTVAWYHLTRADFARPPTAALASP